MNYILDDHILERHLRIVVGSNFTKPDLSKRTLIRFRCNICGDSKTNKFKQRGYLLYRTDSKKNRKTWQFYCHNCQKSMLAVIWMKNYFPSNYTSYVKECLSQTKTKESEIEWTKLEVKRTKERKEEKIKIKKDELEDIKHFVPILNGTDKYFNKARTFCALRKIPEDVWSKWFLAVDGKFKNRVIIPFFDNEDDIYYWQGRALFDYQTPKYLNRQENRDEAIYGIYNIDKTKPIIVQEGPIDSIFVKNSIATLGISYPQKIKDFLSTVNSYYLFDNDKDGRKKSYQYLLEGKYVFLWDSFLKFVGLPNNVKDINELILNKYSTKDLLNFDVLKPFFTNNIFDKIYLTGGY